MSPEAKRMVDSAAAKLIEHFDSVQIFVTSHEGGKSIVRAYDSGAGNYYARVGHIREWMLTQEQYTKSYADLKQREAIQNDREKDGDEPTP